VTNPIRRSRAARSRAVAGALLVLALAGCSGGAATPLPSAASTPSAAPASEAPSAQASPQATPPDQAAPAKVRLALDWTPNTNHTAFYVAEAMGWYDEARVELEVLPYGGTAPETLVAATQAECAISFQDAMTFAAAAGAPLVSTMAILQHTAQEIAVLDESPIVRPKDLDGRIYAGFGYPNEVPTLQAVIRDDGGTGTFDTVTLDTAAYEALYAKRADFVITFSAWEGIEAEQRGVKLRAFQFTDYGFPDFYQVVLACNRDWVAANPETAAAFVGASARGLQFAASSPDEAAAILVEQNPGVFDANPELPLASARFMAAQRLLVDASGNVGVQTLETWAGYSGFLYEQGLLTDADGKPLASPPDYATLFTNDLLPPTR
jgi:ABC-type nitrate/sulfonate/bicarbonate transport system substrate-binding protein